MIHHHTHSEHSFLDGVPKIDDLVEYAASLDMEAITVTDHGECSGHLRLQKAAKKHDIKPIFGMEGYFIDDRNDRTVKLKGAGYEHMTVIAKNNVGLRNLWALSSLAWTEGMYYDPRFDWELLERYREGLIVTGGCMAGAVSALFVEDGDKYNPDRGVTRIGRLLELFGEDFFFELHTFQDPSTEKLNQTLIDLAMRYGIPLIACSDSHYLRPEDWENHELLTAAQMKKTHDDPTRYQYGPNQLHLHSADQVVEKLSYLDSDVLQEAIKNTHVLADRCGAQIKGITDVPTFLGTPERDEEKLWGLAWERIDVLSEKAGMDKKTKLQYARRLRYELDLIIDKKFSGYFLIVADLVHWAKQNGYLMGPSRGSVGGSLLAYALDITEIDPLPGGLLFERFIDPGRPSFPDIDIDCPKNDRDKIREYLERKYHIVTIGTLTELKPKSLVRDFCRVLKVPQPHMNLILKVVGDHYMTDVCDKWHQVYEAGKAQFDHWEKEYPRLFELCHEFANHVRNSGGHAAGVVVSKEPFVGQLPLRFSTKLNDIRTQFDMRDIEELGYLKLDFLGIRTLSTLMLAWNHCRRRHPDGDGHGQSWGESAPQYFGEWKFQWDRYYEDQDVLKDLWDGHNIGVFQLETPTLSSFTKDMKPESLADICDIISIYRPGITRAVDEETGEGVIDALVDRRHGRRETTYKHPILRSILEPTYGQFAYQEQIMFTLRDLAGYSMSEVDRVRKIIGKKKVEDMAKERPTFLERAVGQGVSQEIAESIWLDMARFGEYGFNKSHGWGYAVLAMWCAWMKFHYPHEFMAALLATNPKATSLYIRECKRLGIPVLGPDVQRSDKEFTLTDDGVIHAGLSKVKQVAKRAEAVIEYRPFKDIADFVERTPKKKVVKTAAENLIRVGAFDSLVDDAQKMAFAKEYGSAALNWSASKIALYLYWQARGDFPKLFKCEMDAPCEDPDYANLTNFEAYGVQLSIDDRAYCEEDLLDVPITVDPFGPYYDLMVAEDNYRGLSKMYFGERCYIGGILRKRRDLVTKRGRNPGSAMCQIFIERPIRAQVEVDEEGDDVVASAGELEQIVVWPEQFRKCRPKLEIGTPVLVRVEKMIKGEGLMLRAVHDIRQILEEA